jgi:molecular chaperone HscC
MRDQVQAWIAQFRAVLETQDEMVIREHRMELSRALDALESI